MHACSSIQHFLPSFFADSTSLSLHVDLMHAFIVTSFDSSFSFLRAFPPSYFSEFLSCLSSSFQIVTYLPSSLSIEIHTLQSFPWMVTLPRGSDTSCTSHSDSSWHCWMIPFPVLWGCGVVTSTKGPSSGTRRRNCTPSGQRCVNHRQSPLRTN